MKTFFKAFVSPRFMALCGMLMGAWIYSRQTELRPLSDLLREIETYLIAFVVVLGYRTFVWLVVDKATFYEFKNFLKSIVLDFFVFVAMMLSMVGTLFLLKNFVLN